MVEKGERTDHLRQSLEELCVPSCWVLVGDGGLLGPLPPGVQGCGLKPVWGCWPDPLLTHDGTAATLMVQVNFTSRVRPQ